jgi:PKD domain
MPARYLVPTVVLLAAASSGCGNAPAAPVGTVSVTVTTTTTTTTTIPGVNAGAIGATPSGVGLAAATVYSFAFTTQPSGGVAPYTFAWTFGDGQEGAGPSPAHVYMATGNFTATVTAPFAATFLGQLNDTLTTWTGTVSGFAGCPCSFIATRPSADASLIKTTSADR